MKSKAKSRFETRSVSLLPDVWRSVLEFAEKQGEMRAGDPMTLQEAMRYIVSKGIE